MRRAREVPDAGRRHGGSRIELWLTEVFTSGKPPDPVSDLRERT